MSAQDNSYEDIIHLPHPDSKHHPRMSRQARAAQFAPFAALTGFEDATQETARQAEKRFDKQSEEPIDRLDEYE